MGSSQRSRSQVTSNDPHVKVQLSAKEFKAVLFDMDGVVTKTAIVHSQAWKKTFDAFLKEKTGAKFKEFTQDDYLKYVDGKAREEGVSSFLNSRKIKLPFGTQQDKPGFDTICALGNLKNEKFHEILKNKGVEVYETTVGLIRALKAAGVKVAIITASTNADAVLKAAKLAHVFEVQVDGLDALKMKLHSKPAPDLFLEAAKKLKVSPKNAVVIEDAAAGVEAGKNGRFGLVIGVARTGDDALLKQHGADVVVRDLGEVELATTKTARHGQPQDMRGSALSDLDISDKNWVLTYDSFNPDTEGHRESVCAVGNGYFSTRAAAPESRDDGVHYPGTYLAGAYNRLKSKVGKEELEFEELVNMPNWLSVTFKIEDGEWFDLRNVEIIQYSQKLQLKEGVVYRDIKFRDLRGRESSLSQKWFVHLRQAHMAGIQSILTAHNWAGTVTIRSAIDGRVENNGTRKDPRMSKKHLEPNGSTAGDDTLLLKMITSESRITVAMAARHTLTNSEGTEIDLKDKYIVEPDFVAQDMSVKIAEGQAIDLKKIVSICSSRDPATSEAGLAARRILEDSEDFSALLGEQIDIWGNYWRNYDLFIETTEEHSKMQPSLVVHLNSFHAMQAATNNIVDFDCGIPARGLTGEGYQGHIFWDDLFMFSFINLRTPNITRALLKYRYRRLPEARKIAASMGARGACFPWQSGSTGREETPPFVWIPELNHWAPDHTHLELHVNAAIAYNIWQYYQVTESLEFMHAYGAEILLEIARFFATFSKYNKKTDRFEIHGVIGPDEYHNGYPNAKEPGINNNAYTNVMVAWTLSTALQMLKVLPQDYREQLSHRLRITTEEIELWERISRRMYVPFINDGIIAQFDGYEKLEEFPWHVDNHPDMKQVEVALRKNGLVLNPYKLSKQPDVLMLFYVFSGDELGELFKQLGYRWGTKMIAANIEYYMPRTANTSTLSRVALAWVLSRMNRRGSWDLVEKIAPVRKDPNAAAPVSQQPQSWKIFLEALGSDLFDIEGGSTTREGIHMAAMSGTLDIIQRCYGGIVTRNDVLWLNPQLPAALTRLSFNLHYRGQALELDITHESIKIIVSHSSAQKIKIGFRDRVYALNSGDTKVFKLDSARAHKKVAKKRQPARTKANSAASRDRNGSSDRNGDRRRSSADKRTRAASLRWQAAARR